MHSRYFVTTSIPYVNAKPHIGHALEILQADAITRYLKETGRKVIFQTGTDENASKNVTAARRLGIPVQDLVDANAEKFKTLVVRLGAVPDSFIRTTEQRHITGVEKFWESLYGRDLEFRSYRGLYCEGCEDFVTERGLVDGKCPEHLAAPVEVEESNYFFLLSRYQDKIERLIESDTIRILPKVRKNEVLAFVRSGLHDISVSRDAKRTDGWGVPVPGDPTQRIYVWIDALMNYVTGIGYGSGDGWREIWNEETWKLHVIGKNVWKFHAVYWPALLLSAGLPLPDGIFVHGFLTAHGMKISKSIGNAIDPFEEIVVAGTDALRLYLLSMNPYSDGDYDTRSLVDFYNATVAARIGSTVTRVTALCEKLGLRSVEFGRTPELPEGFESGTDPFRFDKVLEEILKPLDGVNGEIARIRPWEPTADRRSALESLERWVRTVYSTSFRLRIFAPGIGETILGILTRNPIRKPDVLFPRLPET